MNGLDGSGEAVCRVVAFSRRFGDWPRDCCCLCASPCQNNVFVFTECHSPFTSIEYVELKSLVEASFFERQRIRSQPATLPPELNSSFSYNRDTNIWSNSCDGLRFMRCTRIVWSVRLMKLIFCSSQAQHKCVLVKLSGKNLTADCFTLYRVDESVTVDSQWNVPLLSTQNG